MPKLEDLLVDPNEVDEELLAAILLPYTRIEKESGKITFTEEWSKLNNKNKILIYLAARKALVTIKMLDKEEEAQAPNEIEAITGIKGGSLRPALMELLQEKLIAKNPNGYYVPGFKLRTLYSAIGGDSIGS